MRDALDTTHESASRRPVAPIPPFPQGLAATRPAAPAPSRDQWPPLPVAPIARARSRGTLEVERPRAHEPSTRAGVIDARDLWPPLPVIELAEPEPWRDLERQRARDERIAREQVSR